MRINTHKVKITLFIIAIVAASLWVERYLLLYKYYLWQVNNMEDSCDIETYIDEMESISTHVIPLLIETYTNTKTTNSWGRHIAGIVLSKTDREKAENLFIGDLNSKDGKILSDAIDRLCWLKSEKAYKIILPFTKHPNENVRKAVAKYLENFNNKEVINLLLNIMRTDPSENVRHYAADSLHGFGFFIPKEQILDMAGKEAKKYGYDISKMDEATCFNEIPNPAFFNNDFDLKNKLKNKNYFTVYFCKLPIYRAIKPFGDIYIFIDAETKEIIAHRKILR